MTATRDADPVPQPGGALQGRGLHPQTPDGRYFVVRGRLWRLSDPTLDPDRRAHLVNELMSARRAVRDAKGQPTPLREARARVDAAKRALGERGPVWWDDGAPDYNRHLAVNTPYAAWFAARQVPTEPSRDALNQASPGPVATPIAAPRSRRLAKA